VNVLDKLNGFERQISMLLAAHEVGRQESVNELKSFQETLMAYDESGLTTDEKKVMADVREMFAKNVKKLEDQLASDLSFLRDQKSAISDVKNVSDKKKQQELAEILSEDFGDVVTDFDAFQKELDAQASEDRQFLTSIVQDLTHMLREGGFKELEAVMAEFTEDADGEDALFECGDEDCSDENCESDCDLSDEDLDTIKDAFMKMNNPYLHDDEDAKDPKDIN
jgi:hypothetical protein